ncbi:hypothetical protein GCM10025868_27260 [Angustibacter aerolatus]|uniref:Uncharacterized protein n=1 Tax=Angustibacter aerolatus TaxID=1162965 RepID=A0ABQ6JGW1_9ACTN|nr:hypothetical protein [Angustibacter aerolatus]GMA87476.1 hypothetical protein GCM10025868_27260 [Angustibacter aerolatus]
MPDFNLQFNPATSLDEASSRMFALTASSDPGTRGPRRSLHALARALKVEVDSNAVVAVVGGQIAAALGVDWRLGREYVGYRVTLRGMNALLHGASVNFAQALYLARGNH